MKEFLEICRGIIDNPGPTIGRVMDKKRWLGAFALILLTMAIVTYVTYPITKAEGAKFIRDSEMADKLSEDQLASLDQFTPGQRLFGALTQLPLAALTLLLAAFFVYLLFKVAGAAGDFSHYFSAVAHASLLDMFLGGVVRAVLVAIQKTMFVHTGLTILFPALDFRSLSYLVLAQFDFFSLWYLLALALGIAHFTKISVKRSIATVVFYFLFKSLVFVSFSHFSMKLLGM
ncbi:MAG: YIP1 family protein [Candidatus Aminicenantes bacterium]|nr:YIP1 family protein [Candidatus Aminicenantes bacterium]